MLLAKIAHGEFVAWVTLARDYPDTSFPNPLTASDLPDGVVSVSRDVEIPIAGMFERVVRADIPVLDHARWVLPYLVEPMTAEEAEAEIAALAATVRAQRDYLLATSDWTQSADAPVDRPLWAAYRQALRVLPEQAGFPIDCSWPEPPVTSGPDHTE